MPTYKIKSPAVAKFETIDRQAAERKLAEIRKKDPSARLLTIPANR